MSAAEPPDTNHGIRAGERSRGRSGANHEGVAGANPQGVLGLGTDLVDVARFRLALDRQGDRLVARLFSDAERDYAFRHRNPAPRLAARFGAKEAVMKALGVGLWKFALRDVEVVRLASGQPTIALYDKAAELAEERHVRAWHLTLTHTDTMAAATAIALGDGAIALGDRG